MIIIFFVFYIILYLSLIILFYFSFFFFSISFLSSFFIFSFFSLPHTYPNLLLPIPPTSKRPMLPLSHWFPLFSFLFFSFLLLLFFSSNLSPICSFSASSLHDSYTSSFTTSPTPPPNFQQTHHSHPHDPIFFSLPPFLSFLPPHKLSTTTPIEKAHCHMSPSSISFLHYSNQFIFILNKIKLHIIKFISVKRCESINF